MRLVCLHKNGFGQFCEKPNGHTGNHRARVFSADEAHRAFIRQKHVGDSRWEWTGTGWRTYEPALVDEALQRLAASKTQVVA